MSAKKLKSVGLIIGAIVLAFVGFWLLLISTQPGVVQGQDSWPTLIPPDLTVAAEFANMPPCCGDDPAPTGVAEQIQSEQATLQAQGGIVTLDNELVADWLTPSSEWVSYESKFGYKFEYPKNFVISEMGDDLQTSEIQVSNHPPAHADPFSQNKLYISITCRPKLLTQNVDDFVASLSLESRMQELERVPVELAHGYSAVRMLYKSSIEQDQLIVVIYIDRGEFVCQVNSQDSIYNDVFEKFINSLVLP